MKGLLAPLLVLAATAGVLGLFAWAPWTSEERARELAWLEGYAAWLHRAPSLDAGRCDAVLEDVGPAPTERLKQLADAGLKACASFPDRADWQAVEWAAAAEIVDWHFRHAASRPEPALGRVAARIAGTSVRAHCWPAGDWRPLAEEWDLLDERELWPAGFADPVQAAIHLSPEVCAPLRRFFTTDFSPVLNDESLDLSQALLTLAHEAEHVRDPNATEAEVECYALQRVRDVVRKRGRSPAYANELALLAWQVAYPRDLPEYRTGACRDGGKLDLRPRSRVWP